MKTIKAVLLMDDTTDEEAEEKVELLSHEDDDDDEMILKKQMAKQKRAAKRAQCPDVCSRYRVINKTEYGEIEMLEFDTIDCRGAYIIEGMPSEGLPASIAAQYLVEELELPLIGEISNPSDTICVVTNNQPSNALRIYGDRRVVVFTSRVTLDGQLAAAAVYAIKDFAKRHHSPHIFTLEGVLKELTISEEVAMDQKKVMMKLKELSSMEWPLRFVSNDQETAEKLKELGAKPVRGAVIKGVTGGLIARAATSRSNITALLTQFSPFGGHTRAALRLIDCLIALTEIEIDSTHLQENAEFLEHEIRKVFEKAAGQSHSSRVPSMYI